jgi:enoyl-CoA hydratase/3-hydroxyacyl-CoA dehydrogenase
MSQSKKTISKLGVVGAGNMGSGIAQKIAQEGINVVMVDVKEEFVSRGLSNIKKILEEGIEQALYACKGSGNPLPYHSNNRS